MQSWFACPPIYLSYQLSFDLMRKYDQKSCFLHAATHQMDKAFYQNDCYNDTWQKNNSNLRFINDWEDICTKWQFLMQEDSGPLESLPSCKIFVELDPTTCNNHLSQFWDGSLYLVLANIWTSFHYFSVGIW